MVGFGRYRAFGQTQHPPLDHWRHAPTYSQQASQDGICHSDRSLLGSVAGGAAEGCCQFPKHGVTGVIDFDTIISSFSEDKLRTRHSHYPLQPIVGSQADVYVPGRSPSLLSGQQGKFAEYPQTFSHEQQCHNIRSNNLGSYSNSGDRSGMMLESSGFEELWTARAGVLLEQSQRR